MPTPIFICGAECNLPTTVQTVGVGERHWSGGSQQTVVTSGPTPMRSTRCYHLAPSGVAAYYSHIAINPIVAPSTMVGRIYIYFQSLPLANQPLFIFSTANGSSPGIYFRLSNNSLVCGDNLGTALTGKPIATGIWYCVDLRVTDGPRTIDGQVDGVPLTQYTSASPTSNYTGFTIGLVSAHTVDWYQDDIIASNTAADYPIGPGTTVSLYPNGDGAHGGSWAVGVFKKGANGTVNAARSDTNIWQSLANPLPTSAGSVWVVDSTGVVSTDYVEFTVDDLPLPALTATINGAMLVIAERQASLSVGSFGFSLGATPVFNGANFGNASLGWPCAIYNTDAGGTPWTPTSLNAMICRFWSLATPPALQLHGFCWEVDYATPRSAGYASIFPFWSTVPTPSLTPTTILETTLC